MAFFASCCAWFSVIGSFTFFTMSMMLFNMNLATIEHKFKLTAHDTDKIKERGNMMFSMVWVMIVAAISCFVLSFY